MSELSIEMMVGLALFAGVLAGFIVAEYRSRQKISVISMDLEDKKTAIGLKEQHLKIITKDLELHMALYKKADLERQGLEKDLSKALADIDGMKTRIEERDSVITDSRKELERVRVGSADKYNELNERFNSLNSDYTELKTTLSEKTASFEEQQKNFEKTKDQLKVEFQNLANQILEEKGKSFGEASKSSLDIMLNPLREQIKSFQERVNEVHTEAVKGNTSLESEIKKVLDIGLKMSGEANNLATALKGDKKTTGNWGEVQLEKTLQLAGLVNGDHYESQDDYKDAEGRTKFPDFVVKLPDHKHMVLDSKVSLVAYDRAVSAENDAEHQQAIKEHVAAVRKHIDDLHKKDYSNLIGMRSPDFVLMFLPIEPAYIEAMKHQKDLFNYGYNKNVIMVSHTTLMPILRTVANLWRIERGNEEAREISGKAGDIFNQVCVVAERLENLGRSLNAVSNHYNNTVKGLVGKQGLHGKVERFKDLSNKVSKDMPKLEALHTDFEHERLELVIETVGNDAEILDTKESETGSKEKEINNSKTRNTKTMNSKTRGEATGSSEIIPDEKVLSDEESGH